MKQLTTYAASRLRFLADVIEPMAMNNVFEIVTPIGTWRMTKAEFYRVFPNVVSSGSYVNSKYYHYPKPPQKAEQLRVK